MEGLIDNLLSSLHFLAHGLNSGKADQKKDFFKMGALMLGRHNYSRWLWKMCLKSWPQLVDYKTTRGLARGDNLRRFSVKECQPCLEENFDSLKKKSKPAIRETRLGAIFKHLTGT